MKYMAESGKEGPTNPYMLGGQKWLEQYGDLVKARNDWRLTAFGSIAVAAIATGGLVAVLFQHSVVPYVVELDRNSEVVKVVRADVAARPNTNQIKASLRTWIIGARTVYSDPHAVQDRIDTTYAMTLPNSAAYQALVEYHSVNDPFVRAKKETVEVTVVSVFPITGKTWQIEWEETTRDVSGKLVGTIARQGSFTVKIIPPTTDKQVLVNALGVYVEEFAWTSRL